MTAGAPSRFSADRLRAALGTVRPKPAPVPIRRAAALEALYPGREIETDRGACFIVEWSFPLDHRHGRYPLGAATALNDRGASCISQVAGQAAPKRPVFFDTETTGLSGGTGTYAFLIGLGSIEGEHAIVRQYLMRDYDEELALLEAVSGQLAEHDALITYNGKSFDVPLIQTRFIASRRTPRIPHCHLDLLFAARRLLRGRLDGCALSDIERAVLGHHRTADLPSWMIPSVFFQFVRGGDPRLLGGVLEHNRDDILSLLTLTGWLNGAYQPAGETDGWMLPRVARTYDRLGWREDAIEALQRAVVALDEADNRRVEAALYLARLQRGVGAGSDAESMWRLAAEHPTLGIDALVAWAKYLEHERRDFDRAREVVERAILRADLRARAFGQIGNHPLRQALEHRLARINRRARKC